jgi:flavin reductase
MDKRLSTDKTTEISHEFVDAMAAAAFGVSIITTSGAAGRFGLTVSAISSVSAEPPTLLACVNRKNPIESAITKNRRFAVNLLSEQQMFLAKAFAGRPEQGGAPYEFSDKHWLQPDIDLPLLKAASANFICELETFSDVGTHRIFIGRVISAKQGTKLPLVYSHRKFGRFVEIV